MRLFFAFLLLIKIFHTDEEWREKLGPERYHIMREKGTERGFVGKYVYCEEEGIYHCAACALPLFDSKDKYDSGAGWPCFTKPISPKNVYYLKDAYFRRYELLCGQCDCHLGHVFDDGPPPKRLRYCVNSIALALVPAKEQSLVPFALRFLP